MCKLVYVKSEQKLMSEFYSSMAILKRRTIRIDTPKVELCKFRNEKDSHAQHAKFKKGSKGRHSSNISESNHSGDILLLNDDEKLLNIYFLFYPSKPNICSSVSKRALINSMKFLAIKN